MTDSIRQIFLNAINVATDEILVGIYIAGFMFCVGFIPSVAYKMMTVITETE